MTSRASSTPRFDAPSISIVSVSCPVKIAWAMSSLFSGLFSALAKIRAIEVLPTPRVPLNR